MNETATTASKADRTESEGAVMPHCSQGVGLGSLPRLCARTASQTPSVLTSTSVCRDCQPGPQRAHFQVCVQGLPATAPACSLPSPCAGTASQAPNVLTSTSVCRDCQPGPQHAHFHVQGLPARAPACSLTFLSCFSFRVSAGEKGASSRHEVKKK